MRVLVTGHDGYIGASARPAAPGGRPRCRRARHRPLRGCALRRGRRPTSRRSARTSATSRRSDLVGFDAVLHLAASRTTRSATSTPALTYDINHRGTVRTWPRAAKAAGVPRFVFSSSCSLYGAHGDDSIDEPRRVQPVTPYGESKVLAEQDLAALADDDFSPTYPAQRHRLRRLVAPAGRSRREQPRGVRGHDRAGTHEERRHAVATARPHRGHRARVRGGPGGAARARPRRGVQRRPDDRELPDPRRRGDRRGCGPRLSDRVSPTAGPDTRNYRVDCEKIARVLPDFRPTWTVAQGVEELLVAFREAGLTTEALEGARFQRIRTIQGLLGSGRLDADLRWAAISDAVVA